MDVLERIESKLDKTVSAGTPIDASIGGVKLENMIQMMELAKAMALSGPAVPPVFRGNPGLCLGIWLKATKFNFDPFSLAEHAYVTVKREKGPDGRWGEVETLAFDSTVVRAIINAHAPIKGQINYTFEGEGDAVVCIAAATLLDGTMVSHRSKTLAERKATLRRNEEGKVKGSPLWDEKPLVQFAYDTGRDLCRIYFPEVLMGWKDRDDFEDAAQTARAATAKDVTPKPSLKDRLNGSKGRGFDARHIEREASAAETGAAKDPPPAPPAPPVTQADPETSEQGAASTIDEGPSPADAYGLGREARSANRPCSVPRDVEAMGEPFAEAWKAGWTETGEAADQDK